MNFFDITVCLEVKFEEEIFKVCKRWVEVNNKVRSQNNFELLQQVRLALVKPRNLANVIATFLAYKPSTSCQQLISNAELCHSNPSKRNAIDVGEVGPRGFRPGTI